MYILLVSYNQYLRYSPTELHRLQNFLPSIISGAVNRYISNQLALYRKVDAF